MIIKGYQVEDFLRSLGFRFTIKSRAETIPVGLQIDKLLDSRHHRIETRKTLGPEVYGRVFEHLVYQLLLSRFSFHVISNVSIKDEGKGGDFDLLAFQSPHLIYVECKTTSDIKFSDIFERHEFLHPGLTLILIDLPKKDLEPVVFGEIQSRVTPINLISDPSSAFALYHTHRNIFIGSGEDLDKVIRRALRYFHQKVVQSAYFS